MGSPAWSPPSGLRPQRQGGRIFELEPLWEGKGHKIAVAKEGHKPCRLCHEPILAGTQILPGRYHGTRSTALCFVCAQKVGAFVPIRGMGAGK